jgi:hypothetical protein
MKYIERPNIERPNCKKMIYLLRIVESRKAAFEIDYVMKTMFCNGERDVHSCLLKSAGTLLVQHVV